MTGLVKGIIISAVVIVIVGILAIGAGVYWISSTVESFWKSRSRQWPKVRSSVKAQIIRDA